MRHHNLEKGGDRAMPVNAAAKTYQQRLDEFVDARIFYEPVPGHFPPADGLRCQACGSPAPKHLRLVEDISGNRYLVGQECYFQLRKAFSEWPEVKRLGRAFEIWIRENESTFKCRQTWQLVELYKQQNSEDKAG
jgi:hypothetical protein